MKMILLRFIAVILFAPAWIILGVLALLGPIEYIFFGKVRLYKKYHRLIANLLVKYNID